MRQRVFEGNKLVIASHNEGKIREINVISPNTNMRIKNFILSNHLLEIGDK